MKKFIAWDVFKQNSIKSKVQNKKSIPSVLRKIFVSRLITENAEAAKQGKPPVFTSLIRARWADRAAQFTPWLAGLLPQLGSWFSKTTGLTIDAVLTDSAEKAASGFDGDDTDIFILARRYAQFMEKHKLFEPAWETPPFNDDGKECFIFFPESLSDYGEYRELLATSGHVKIIGNYSAEDLFCDTFYYTNSRSEITEAALYIRALHENRGISWDSVAVCIPDSENYEAYVLREFTNRNIPFVKRTSKPLALYPAGQFFRSVVDCTSRDFAFSALASLILNRNLPWKDTAQINNLAEFGINNNCISSWTEKKDGKEQTVNVWEDAFENPYGGIDPAARKFYAELRRRLHALRTAGSFHEVRKQYFAFRERFFDMDKCSDETDLVLSRCVSELTCLCEIEKSYPEETAADPFSFFCEYLGEINYLAQTRAGGVNILPYKTAAAAPFDCHIVLCAGQKNISVVYNHLDFLPRKKREKLGIFDEDASASFINLHKFNSLKNTAFFCSEQTFSGYTIPHAKIGAPSKPESRYASQPENSGKFSKDYFYTENSFDISEPLRFHEVQIDGFKKWSNRCRLIAAGDGKWITGLSLLELIRQRFANRPECPGKYSVSATSLQPYYRCSLIWLFEHVLALGNVEIEASLMAENITGTVYHNALGNFFSELKEKKETLAKPLYTEQGPSLPEGYGAILEKCVNKIFAEFPFLEGGERPKMSSLTSRFLRAGKRQTLVHLENCLVRFLALFAGCRIAGAETLYQTEYDRYFLNGKVDCILEDTSSNEEKKYIIVDFKLKNTPKRVECNGEGENGLANFQLPMYITLAQENEKIKVHTALFYSILNLEPQVIIGMVEDEYTKKSIPYGANRRILHNSEKYNHIMEELNLKAEQFANEIATGNFTVFESKYNKCSECNYHRICRTTYVINREKNISLGKSQ